MNSRFIQPLALAAGLFASMAVFASPQGNGNGNGIIVSGPLDHTLVDSNTGTSFNIVAGTFDDTGPIGGDWDFNFWDSLGLRFWAVLTYSTAFVVDSNGNVVLLQPGDVVGPGSTFSSQSGSGLAAAWLAGTDGYAGVMFTCDGRLAQPVAGICYGYLHLTTAGPEGYPAVLDDAAFDGDGQAITIAGGGAGSDPVATVTPAFLSLTAAVNQSASATLNIGNAPGSSPLSYAITSATTAAVPKPQLIGSTAGSENSDALAPKLQYLQALQNRPPATFTPRAITPSHHGTGSLPQTPQGAFAFVADDGTYEAATGLQNSTQTTAAVYVNRFVATGALTIDSISVEWPSLAGSGSSGVTLGMQPNLVVYYDAAATGDIANAVRLGSDQIVSIDRLDTFQTYATNFSVPGAGDVYIGFVDEWALVLGGYDGLVSAAALNTTANASVTYVSGSSDANVLTDIVDLANNDLNGSGASFGIGGAWLVRATGSSGGGAPCTGPAVDWLSVAPASGMISGGGSAAVTVTATPAAAGLAPGTHTADLCLTTNDPTQALIVVPVSLSVTSVMCNGGGDEIFCSGFDGSGSTTGPAAVYTNRDNFAEAIAPGYYQNDFHDVQGKSGALHYSDPVSGIAYTVDASSSFGLWNGNGFIAPSNSGDKIVVTFTGTPVTAIGGNFWAVDVLINPFPGFEVVITLSDGSTATLTSNGPFDFRGFTSAQPIASISIDAPPASPDQGDNVWPAMDNLIVGSIGD